MVDDADLLGDHLGRVVLVPRLLRLRDAPRYLGMDKNRFNREVRPSISVIPIGRQGIAFDRLDLDAWVDEYKRRNGRPAAKKLPDAQKYPPSPREAQTSRSTTTSSELAFRRAVERAIARKR